MAYDIGPRLDVLAKLEPGWDSYGAYAITPAAIEAARRYAASLEGLAEHAPDACPMVCGGVQVLWYTSGFDIEVEFAADGAPLAHVYEHGSDEESDLPLDSPVLTEALARLGVKAGREVVT